MAKTDIKSIFLHKISKRRCNVKNLKAIFYVGKIEIPSVVFIMDSTPNQERIYDAETFHNQFEPEFING